MEEFPQKLKLETENLTDEDFNKKYRPGGWTIRQIVNHCADSHMNSLIRFKLAMTEDLPTIKPYSEDLWAELADSKNFPIESSIKILEGLHERWVVFLKSMSENDFEKAFIHPETQEKVSLKNNIGF
ncbi:YfiT family bacillithiol transferase [Chryseobacterium sp.]|uniref:YfiT family bacillithiol transferase n=1 Tax=Chryseobacterium sp. TaxID=1871047 RepID=UPI00388F82A4